MSKVVIQLPLPRVVTGVLSRCREEERVLVTDVVPLLVPSVTASEAPVAVRLEPDTHAYERLRMPNEVRLHDGALWLPVTEGRDMGGVTPEVLRASQEHVLPDLLAKPGRTVTSQALADWRSVSRGCAMGRGVVPSEERRFSSVASDGRTDQAALAAYVQGNLLLVDGRVHHRCPAPSIRVETDQFGNMGAVLVKAVIHEWSHTGDNGPGHPPDKEYFAIDDAEGARAFAAAMAAGMVRLHDGRAFEVVEHDLGRCMPGLDLWRSPFPGRCLGWVSSYLRNSQSLVGHLDDEGLGLVLSLRGLVTGLATQESALSAIDGLRGLSALVAALDDGPLGHGGTQLRDSCGRMASGILTRMDVVDGPRLGIAAADPDADAMLGLGTGL